MNLEKLDEAIAYIEAHPEEHDQNSWLRRQADGDGGWCRTSACLAGTIAILAGWKPVFPDPVGGEVRSALVEKDGIHRGPWQVADDLIGLTYLQSDELFLDADDLDDIKRIRDEIAAGEL